MQADVIILGQGICGTLLSHSLMALGQKVVVIDQQHATTPAFAGTTSGASMAASGVINPVTGKRLALSWRISELMPAAQAYYQELEKELGINLLQTTGILDFHSSAQSRELYEQKADAGYPQLHIHHDEATWQPYFHFHHGIGEIHPCLLINLHLLIQIWRQQLKKRNALLETDFQWSDCHISPEGVSWQGICARYIICCAGAAGMDNPWFNRLPFAANKGEALILSIPGLPATHIYRQAYNLIPWSGGLWWAGASFEWNFEQLGPTTAFRQKIETQLQSWLKLPYTIEDHLASARPATLERRPFAGLHPLHPAVGILNGMGTKGCSMAPVVARQLAAHLTQGTALWPEVDVRRHRAVLSR
jgi:glycine/D-amino acid oxidase-like deaminating enzyme